MLKSSRNANKNVYYKNSKQLQSVWGIKMRIFFLKRISNGLETTSFLLNEPQASWSSWRLSSGRLREFQVFISVCNLFLGGHVHCPTCEKLERLAVNVLSQGRASFLKRVFSCSLKEIPWPSGEGWTGCYLAVPKPSDISGLYLFFVRSRA